MTRRGVFTATIEVLSLDGEPSATIPSAHESLVFVVTGRFTVGGAGVSTIDLGPLDAAIVKGYARIVVNGTGTALLIRLHPIAEIPARGLPGASGTTHPFTRDASIDANGALKSD